MGYLGKEPRKDGGSLTLGATLDTNGNEVVLDADADTSITADTDDQIDIKIAGADDFKFTANAFTVLSGSTIVVDDTTDSTSTTTGSIQTDGGLGVAKDLVVGDDILLKSDASVVHFGENGEVTLTHVHNTGLRMEDTDKFQLGAGGDLSLSHNGTNSLIENATGALLISGDDIAMNSSGGESMFSALSNGNVRLYYNNAIELATTVNGIVVGGATAEVHHSAMKAAQFGARGFILPYDSGATYVTSNAFYNASGGWEYPTAGSASILSLNNGSLYYYHAENGSDGGTPTLVERLNIYHNNSNNDNYLHSRANRNSVSHYFNNDHSSDPYGLYIEHPNATKNNTDHYFLSCIDGSSNRLKIFSNGTVKNSTGTYTTLSDERLKSNIVDAKSQWEDIKALKFKNFTKFDNPNLKQLGLIAQDVEKVSPNLVYETPPEPQEAEYNSEFGTVVDDTDKPINYKETDTIPDGKKVGDIKEYEKKVEVKSNVKGVKESILYMKAVKALQEAMTRIETLEAKVKTLESA